MDVLYNSVEELLSDESFLGWYFETDTEAVEKWNSRLSLNPSQKKIADEAVQLLNAIKIKEQAVDSQRLKTAEFKLMTTTAPSNNTAGGKVVSIWSKNVKWMAAAAIILLSSIGIWQLNRTSGKLALQTAYGETRNNVLPDGSQVMLNANTTINYSNWKEGTDREVWLNGEAYFHVKKTAKRNRFVVHSGNFDVVVTGTQFNVINRDNKSNVYLKEGSVIIECKGKEIHMKPGDYVEISKTGIQKKEINSAPVLAWTDHKFIFENTPMKEVASMVSEVFGIKVTLANEATASSTISGVMQNDNLDVFLQSLEALSDFVVSRTEQGIQISKK
jgi:transmembrane sensor